MLSLLLGVSIFITIAGALFGWPILLIIGIVKCVRRTKNAKKFLVAGCVWGLLAVMTISWGIWTINNVRTYHEAAKFNPAEYDGPVGTLVLPYNRDGQLYFRLDTSTGEEREFGDFQIAEITDGKTTLPAGRLGLSYMSFSLKLPRGGTAMLSILPQQEYSTFLLEPDATHTLTGGPPLTASIEIRSGAKRGRPVELDFALVDTAGNDITLRVGNTPPQFEAISPTGECFWRDKFEYG